MAEIDITYTLVTSGGTVTLDPDSNNPLFRVSEITGLDSHAIRSRADSRPDSDGLIPSPSRRGGRTIVVEGICADTNMTDVNTKLSDLAAKLITAEAQDATLKWTPSGGAARQAAVRVIDGMASRKGPGPFTREFQFTLLNYSGQIVDQTELTEDINPDTTEVIANAGNARTWPKLRVYGPITNGVVTLTNTTSGRSIRLAGVTIANGSYAEIDTLNQTIRLNGTGKRLDGMLDPVNSDFWALSTGNNSITFAVTGESGVAKLTVVWRNGRA